MITERLSSVPCMASNLGLPRMDRRRSEFPTHRKLELHCLINHAKVVK